MRETKRSNRRKHWGIAIRLFGALCCTSLAVLSYSAPARALRALPDVVRTTPGESPAALAALWDNPFLRPSDAAVTVAGQKDASLLLEAGGTVSCKLFGVIPVKEIRVVRTERVELIPGGAAVGIAIRTKGVLVVGVGTVDTAEGALSPGAVAGIRAGDVILSADGQEINSADALSVATAASGGTVRLFIDRSGEAVETVVRLVRDADDGAYRIGLWVRDSTAGVGTVSFVDPETGLFAALGHPVSDIDTQSLLPLREGTIVPTEILDVRTGVEGSPGELIGTFSVNGAALGRIRVNSEYGIFGALEKSYQNPILASIPLGYASDAHTGKAQLLATVSRDGVEAFDCEIVRINPQSGAATKGMIVDITDEALLARTGGIVQGMSGCPVIQDGKLVGVVTHVFVNDPARGYCVYAEWMFDKMLTAAA